MPTITTTVTSASNSGAVVTQTTTKATPEPPTPAPVAVAQAAAAAAAVRPPKNEEDVTAEWLSAALHENGHLHPLVNVASIAPLVNIGEGRGYANYSWKIVATYDQPVSPDTPTKFVLKQLNQSFAPQWEEGRARVMADKSYVLECKWYEEIRGLMPVPQPKMYWSGAESPANPSVDFGVYGVLMEWLGDDLKKVEAGKNGVTEEECVQAMEAMAKIHARFWNSEFMANWDPIFTPEETVHMIEDFGGGPGMEPSIAFAVDVLGKDPALGERFGAYAKAAIVHRDEWYFKSKHSAGQTTVCTFDYRTDNIVYQKVAGAADQYQAVVIDHQIWNFGGAPLRDLACFFAFSVKPDQTEDRVAVGIKAYHDALVAAGVSTYSWEQCNADFNDACWHGVVLATFGGKMVAGQQTIIDANEPGSKAYEEATTMKTNMEGLFCALAANGHKLLDVRGAYATAPFELCPEDAHLAV